MSKKIIKLTESDLIRLVKRVIKEQEFERELPIGRKGILGHKDYWTDEEDRPVNPDEFDYDEEIEFGPDDFEDYISHTETDFPGNKWSFGMKGVKGDDRSPGKGYYDRYQKQGPIKLRKSKMSEQDDKMEKQRKFVPCAKLGVKSPGLCDLKRKMMVTPCAKLGVKSPGYCYVDTKNPVP